jgi:hypothetical protein
MEHGANGRAQIRWQVLDYAGQYLDTARRRTDDDQVAPAVGVLGESIPFHKAKAYAQSWARTTVPDLHAPRRTSNFRRTAPPG